MSGSTKRLLAIAAVGLAVAACSDLTSDGANTVALSQAFQTVPAGFSSNTSSFDASGDDGLPFLPGTIDRSVGLEDRGGNSGKDRDHPEDRDRHDGFGGRLRGLLMGGGLGPNFIGAIAFGHDRGDGPFHVFDLRSTCTFDSGTGRVTCPDRTSDRGFTVTSSFAFQTDAGVAQPKFDALTTNLVNAKIDVSGTKTRDDGSVKATVHHSSDQTVEGLAPGKTERKVNGTAQAHEESNGTRDDVKFTAVRDASDVITNLVIPIVDGRPTLPSSGKVVRSMTVTITPESGTATTKSRSEEITFDGTNVISVKITQDGTTKNCTITLPAKKLVCE
jgi:hypothetical protein